MKNLQFSDDMATARAEGRKDVTRRLIPFKDPDRARLLKCEDGIATFGDSIPDDSVPLVVKCRYRPGDIVYHGEALVRGAGARLRPVARYRRDSVPVPLGRRHSVAWRWQRSVLPSRFCPTECARLFSRVVSVRAERLHEITVLEARREGVTHWRCGHPDCFGPSGEPGIHHGPRAAFMEVWQSINSKRAPWLRNPWVWRIALSEPLSREEALRLETARRAA